MPHGKSIALALALMIVLWAPLSAHSQNLVVNGSFETVSATPTADIYTTSFGALATSAVSNWTLGTSTGTAYDGLALSSGGLGTKTILDGSNALFVQGTGSASQAITLGAGLYTLSFYAMGRTNGPNGANQVTVTLGSLVNQTVQPTNTTQTAISSWIRYTYTFTTTAAGTYTLRFAGVIPYGTGSDYTTFIDRVSVVAGVQPPAFVTVINPSFEDSLLSADTYTTPYGTLNPQTGVPGWQFTSSQGDSFAGIGNETGTSLGSPKYIPQGWQTAFVQGTGGFSQTVTFDSAQTYVIRFRAKGRTNGGAGAETIAVSVDGQGVGTFAPTTTDWSVFTSNSFPVTTGVHTIAFAGTVAYSQADRASFIDAVQIVTPAEAAAVVSPPTSPVYDVVFVGDSITAGATLSNSATQASCVQCMASLGQRFNAAIRMSNQGHSGHTTVDWLPSTNSSSDFAEAVAAATTLRSTQPGQVVFSIMLGTNDSAQSGPNGSPVSPANYLQNLRSIVDQFLVKFPTAMIFVHYPTWYSPNTQNSSLYGSQGLARLQTYFPEIDQLVSDCATAHPGLVFSGDKLAFNHFSTSYMTELTPESGAQGTFYLHPNVTGAVVLGKYWADAIAPSLHLARNDSYGAWLQSRDITPGMVGTGFMDTSVYSGITNGLLYGVPKGLNVAQGSGNTNLTANIRNDSAVVPVLESSSDLMSWSPLSWSVASDQTGVAVGFLRYTLQDPTSNPKKFYHLKLND